MPTTISGTDGVSAVVDGTIVAADIASGAVTQSKLASNVATTGPAFRAYPSTATSVNNGAITKVTLDAEDFDTSNCFSSSAFTPNVAGYYQINGSVSISGNTATDLVSILRKNGNDVAYGDRSAATNNYSSQVTDLIYFNGTTDYLELFVYHNTGGVRTVAADARTTYLSGFLARAA